MTQSHTTRELEIELLALDLSTCTRCTGTLENIEKALSLVRGAIEATGTTVELRKTVVDSVEAAREHRFVSSPTIRVGGRDIVLETRESPCESCSDLCGCSEGTSCRVWTYQGAEHTEAPVGLIVEALLGELVGDGPVGDGPVGNGSAAPATDAYELPDNLRRFFAAPAEGEPASADACCSTEELASCCEPSEKASCCGEAAPA